MEIKFNTDEPLSEKDRQILSIVLDGGTVKTPTEEPAKPTTRATRTANRVKPGIAKEDPDPETEPEQDDDPEEDSEDDLLGDDGKYTLEDAVAKAKELLDAGKQGQVKAALSTAGVRRVSELKGDAIEAFIKAL